MPQRSWSNTLKADLDKLSENIFTSKSHVASLREGERRIVTILFLDIEGFTKMSEELDPEDVHLIIDRCFKILTGEIEKFGGCVDKYEGDRIMALFGSQKTGEHDCENAIRAALGMKSKFSEINDILKERGIKIGIRIGVNTGLVVTGKIGKEREQDFTVMGDAVNLASRLEAAAPANEILIEEETRKIAADVFLYESLGVISVKGREKPCSVFKVLGLNPKRIRRWERSIKFKKSPCIGRDNELRVLAEYFEGMKGDKGRKRIVGIRGSAGIGKSRIVEEFLDSIGKKAGTQCFCLSGEATSSAVEPYSLFVSMVEDFVKGKAGQELTSASFDARISKLADSSGTADSKSVVKGMAPYLKHLAGFSSSSSQQIKAMEPEALSRQIKVAVAAFINLASLTAWSANNLPLIVSLEGLQWADSASLSTLEYFLENLEGPVPLMIVLQYRDDYSLPKFISSAKDYAGIEIGPLQDEALRAMLSAILGPYTFPRVFEDKLFERSMGNPFYLEELIYSLVEGGRLEKREEGYFLSSAGESVELPDSISRIILSRVDLLDENSKRILLGASVAGIGFDGSLLARIGEKTGIPAADFKKSMEILSSGGFIVCGEGDSCSFKSQIVREVIYGTLLNYNKKLLHKLAGEAIKEVYSTALEENLYSLAEHYISAELSEEAYQHASSALKKCLRDYSNEEGLKLAEKMVSLLDSGVLHDSSFDLSDAIFQILETKGRMADILGRREEQLRIIKRLFDISDSQNDKYKKLRALALRGKYYVDVGEHKKARSDGEEMLNILEMRTQGTLYCEAMRIMGMVSFYQGEYEAALNHFRKRADIGGVIADSGDHFMGSSKTIMAGSYNAIGLIYYKMGKLADSVKYYEESLKILGATGDRVGEGMCLGNIGLVKWTMGDFEASIKYYQEALKIFSETGFRKGIAALTGNMGAIFNKLGQYNEALKFFLEASRIRESINDRKGIPYDLINIALVKRALGDFDESLAMLNKAHDMGKEFGDKYIMCTSLVELAELLRTKGDRDNLNEAVRASQDAVKIAREAKLVGLELFAYAKLSRAYLALDMLDEALDASNCALQLIESRGETEKFIEEVYFNHYSILKRLKRMGEAGTYIERAYKIIDEMTKKLEKSLFKASFLNNVPLNRVILEEKKNFDAAKQKA